MVVGAGVAVLAAAAARGIVGVVGVTGARSLTFLVVHPRLAFLAARRAAAVLLVFAAGAAPGFAVAAVRILSLSHVFAPVVVGSDVVQPDAALVERARPQPQRLVRDGLEFRGTGDLVAAAIVAGLLALTH
ncbi:hypothetical protein FE772_18255 [Lysobacter enzymogenes]|nr:hypothetical protein FE772_18255 [Lysobacter enzymogenes]